MKSKTILLLFAIFAISLKAYSKTAEILLGKYVNFDKNTAILPISISNDFIVSGFQFNLQLPDGITIDCQNNDWETTTRTTGFNISGNYSDNLYKFSAYHPNGNTLTGNAGVILNVYLYSDGTIPPGTYDITLLDGYIFEEGNVEDIEVSNSISLLSISSDSASPNISDFQIYSQNINVEEGQTQATLNISMKNSQDVEFFEFDVEFPSGFDPVYNAKDKDYFIYGDRAGRKDYVDVETSNGFHVINDYFWLIEAGDDIILQMNISLPNEEGTYSLKISNQSISTAIETFRPDDFSIKITIGNSEDNYINLQHATTYQVSQKIEDVNVDYIRNFVTTNWQALYVPFEMNYNDWKNIGKVAKLIDVDEANGEIKLIWEEVNAGNVHPNTPYIFKPNEVGVSHFIVNSTNLEASENGSIKEGCITLTGIYEEKTDMATSGAYGLRNGAFRPTNDDGKTLKPYLIFLSIQSGNPKPSQIACLINDETSHLEDLLLHVEEDACYNLKGIKINKATKGILIQNGKKTIIH